MANKMSSLLEWFIELVCHFYCRFGYGPTKSYAKLEWLRVDNKRYKVEFPLAFNPVGT